MQVSERQEFSEIFARLCNVFDKPVSPELADAYWKATEYMNVRSFRIACERAIERDERMPRPSQLWKHHREAKSAHRSIETHKELEPQHDRFHSFAQRCLLVYVMEHRGLVGSPHDHVPAKGTPRDCVEPDSPLAKVIAAKNRLVEQFRIISAEEEVTALEFKTALFREFERIVGVKP